ncbi:Predicted small integral membrane protein [Jhaorihella thermophila]|uniref:Predicted small integral membrane protein n=2 Tax=Jhaorihella thermophila TaxID=488547 RepID=A0A1H5T5Y7_9RHOB|nr:Predicted small integral membrane protein [Jhaorihella thermophila]
MKRAIYVLLTLGVIPTALAAAGWGDLGKQQEEAFTWAKWWTEPVWPGFWMAWTRATLAFFIFIFASIALMAILEIRNPGGNERVGVLGLTTTRGDRLFISLLGSAYIFLAWLGLVGTPLWAPLGIAFLWTAFCFWKV